MFQSESFIDNVKVEKGARLRHHSNLDKGPTFTIFVVCQDDVGKSWRGEVVLGGEVILATEPVSDNVAAGAAAERLLTERLLEVFKP